MPSTYFRFELHPRSAPARSPFLERLLESSQAVASVVDWRREAQQLLGVPPGELLQAAPAALLTQIQASIRIDAGAHAFVAAPVHTRASLTSVSLPHGGMLSLGTDESRELAADFNERLAHSGARMIASPTGVLFCVFDTELDVRTCEPEILQGYDLREFQPTGPGASCLKKTGSEIEMWLFGHPINLRRRSMGELEITGFWLWGGGGLVRQLPPLRIEFLGADVLFSAWSGSGPATTPALGTIVRCPAAPGEPAFEEFSKTLLEEAAWLLRRGQVEALHFSCGFRCMTVRRMPRWLFRRTQPWWEYFNESA